MAEDYTVGQLITELNDAHMRMDDSLSIINTNRVEAIVRLVRRADDPQSDPGASAAAAEMLRCLRRAEHSIDRALRARQRGRSTLVEYRVTNFPGSDGGASASGMTGTAGATTATADESGATDESAAERRARRKAGWVWGDLAFAVGGTVLFGAGLVTSVPLAMSAAFIIAKLTYSGWKAHATHADRRKRRVEVWKATGSAYFDLIWTVAGAVVETVPGYELVSVGMNIIDAGMLVKEFHDIRAEWTQGEI